MTICNFPILEIHDVRVSRARTSIPMDGTRTRKPYWKLPTIQPLVGFYMHHTTSKKCNDPKHVFPQTKKTRLLYDCHY